MNNGKRITLGGLVIAACVLLGGSAARAAFCPACGSRKVGIFKASGKATLYSYVIHHRPVPGFTPPYAIAVVALEEGPRMMTNIVGCPQTPDALELDMKLEVAFEKLDGEIAWQASDDMQWAAVLRFQRAVEARLDDPHWNREQRNALLCCAFQSLR